MIHAYNKKSSTAVPQTVQSCPRVTGCAVAGRKQEKKKKQKEREEKGGIRQDFKKARGSNIIHILKPEGQEDFLILKPRRKVMVLSVATPMKCR